MPRYVLDIIVKGSDRASGRLSGVHRVLGRIAQIASGILIAGAIRGITDQLQGLGRSAVEAFINLERMQVGLESLVAREMARGETLITTSTAIHKLTEAEILQIDKLTIKYADLADELEELNEGQQEAIDEFGEGSIEALRYSVAIRELNSEIADTSSELEKLQNRQGASITLTESVRVGTMSLAEALEFAKEPAKRLTDWIVRLSLTTPFREEDIVQSLRVAAGYGFITQHASELMDEQAQLKKAQEDGVVTAQRLTLSLLDLMAAIGLPSENLDRIVLALGQVRAHGKLLAQEIRQMINAGVGLDIMALAMDMTVEEFQALQKEGKILAEDFLPALVELLETDLAGAAERISLTFGGTLLNLRKLLDVLLREFFGPFFIMIGPGLRKIFRQLSSEESLAEAAARGERFAASLKNAWERGMEVLEVVREIRTQMQAPAVFAIDFAEVTFGEGVADRIEGLTDALKEFNPELGFVEGNAAAAEGALGGIGLALGAGGVWGILKKVAAPIIGILVGIVSGVGWLGVAAGLLGAVWEGNWFGIRDTLKDVWEEHIAPNLGGLASFLETEIPEAIAEAKRWWAETFIPALEEGWKWLKGELLPVLKEITAEIGDKLALALIIGKGLFHGFKGVFEEWVANAQTDGLQVLRDIRDIVDPNKTDSASTGFRRWAEIITDQAIPGQLEDGWGPWNSLMENAIVPISEELGKLWKEDTVPTLETLEDVLANLFEVGVQLFGVVLGGFALPILTALADIYRESILPFTEQWWGLLTDIFDIATRLFGGLIVNVVIPKIKELLEWVRDHLNVALEKTNKFLDNLENNIAGDLVRVIVTFVMGAGQVIIGAFRNIASAIGAATGAIKLLREALANIELPWWALPSSPPPAEIAFRGIADAIEAVNDAAAKMPIHRLNGLRLGGVGSQFMAQQQLALAGVHSSGGPVTVEGDSNVFNVPDEAMARFVAHMLQEEKTKRFNEAMGRI
jgi:tape measure domain-containing protein